MHGINVMHCGTLSDDQCVGFAGAVGRRSNSIALAACVATVKQLAFLGMYTFQLVLCFFGLNSIKDIDYSLSVYTAFLGFFESNRAVVEDLRFTGEGNNYNLITQMHRELNNNTKMVLA
jgi:hypothetical protein